MEGRELRRLRVAADMSEKKLAKAFGTYRKQIERWEKAAWFELDPDSMVRMLHILGASSL